MKKLLLLFLLLPLLSQAQNYNYTTIDSLDKTQFVNEHPYIVKDYTSKKTKKKRAKNIILLIGDGMGTAHVYASIVANKGKSYLSTMPFSGFSKTNPVDNIITDSAAGGTALSSGIKTKNKAIGTDKDNNSKETILEMADKNGKSTGLISTSKITHATPASFIAHQPSRSMYDEIAADFLKTDIDIFIGGGKNDFDSNRKDQHSLIPELKAKGYQIVTEVDSLDFVTNGKIAGLLGEEHLAPLLLGRGDMLMKSTKVALEHLSKNKKGFFLMIEGSQIDWGAHNRNVPYLVTEMLDFDKVLGEVLKFAAENGETLVVVTSDHETGGFCITGGDIEKGIVAGKFATGGHTAEMVPIFSYGPGAEKFSGIISNSDFLKKFIEIYGW